MLRRQKIPPLRTSGNHQRHRRRRYQFRHHHHLQSLKIQRRIERHQKMKPMQMKKCYTTPSD
jgi:hypothetical protein